MIGCVRFIGFIAQIIKVSQRVQLMNWSESRSLSEFIPSTEFGRISRKPHPINFVNNLTISVIAKCYSPFLFRPHSKKSKTIPYTIHFARQSTDLSLFRPYE